jgi:probable HAF family extracellular repeat protein
MDLGTLGGTFSYGSDVNDSGQVAGFSFRRGDRINFGRAFLSEPNGGPIHDLGTFGGTGSQANGVNEAGQVVGFADLRGGRGSHAFLSGPNGGALLDLGALGGAFSEGFDVNDSGVVVGFSGLPGNNEDHAFIYSAGTGIQDLNDLIDPDLGLELEVAVDVNNRGQILAGGVLDNREATFLLTPVSGVPDSGSTGLLLGCTLVGFFWAGRIASLSPVD